MRTEEELALLITKFENDVANKSRLKRLAIATDQWFAVLIWNTSQDETISSQIHRKQLAGTATWFDNMICKILNKIEGNHCFISNGE